MHILVPGDFFLFALSRHDPALGFSRAGIREHPVDLRTVVLPGREGEKKQPKGFSISWATPFRPD